MQAYPLLWTLLTVLPAARAVLVPTQLLDDDATPLQLSLEDLEREQEHQQYDLNRPPLLPNHYEWHPTVAASVSPSYIQEAAQLEEAERLHQLQLQHQQLSAGYALPAPLRGSGGLRLYNAGHVSPTAAAAAAAAATTPATIKSATRLMRPIVPFDLDLQLQLNGIQYLNGNGLTDGPALLPRPVPRPLRPPPPPYTFVQQQQQQQQQLRPYANSQPHSNAILLPQSKQFAYAPLPPRNYAPAGRIPLPYPPSFVSITTRRPGNGYAKPFRPSQPDPTPDLFAGRDSKSLLDSYIPSWEVLRLLQHQQQHHQQPNRNVQRHTLAYSVPSLRLFKRDSKEEQTAERSRIVKKHLPKDAKP